MVEETGVAKDATESHASDARGAKDANGRLLETKGQLAFRRLGLLRLLRLLRAIVSRFLRLVILQA